MVEPALVTTMARAPCSRPRHGVWCHRVGGYDTGRSTESGTDPAPHAITGPPPTPPPAIDPREVARHALMDDAAIDQVFIENYLVDRWVPQISSKNIGLSADGIVYDYPDIVRDHEALRAEYGAVLLYSGGYSTYRDPTFWISVAPVGFFSPADALAWCRQANRGPDDCFAKYLSHVASPEGSTVYQR